MLGLHRLRKAGKLQLPLQPPEPGTVPQLPAPILCLSQECRQVDWWQPAEPPRKAEGKGARKPPVRHHGRTRLENSPTWECLKGGIPNLPDRGWLPALERLGRGIQLKNFGLKDAPKGGLLKVRHSAAKLASAAVLGSSTVRQLIYSAAVQYHALRGTWERVNSSFPVPPKARIRAEVLAHRTFVKYGERQETTPTEDTMNFMGIPSYVIRMKFCSLNSKQKAIATLGRLAQLLFNRGATPSVRGYSLQLGCSETGIPMYARYPPRNWRRALRRISRQVVSTYTPQSLKAGET